MPVCGKFFHKVLVVTKKIVGQIPIEKEALFFFLPTKQKTFLFISNSSLEVSLHSILPFSLKSINEMEQNAMKKRLFQNCVEGMLLW